MLDLRWAERSACKGMDTEQFYLKADEHPDLIKQLRVLCNTKCPVRSACLEHALHYEKHGFWAGTTESHRRRIRQQEGIEQRTIRFAYLYKEGDN